MSTIAAENRLLQFYKGLFLKAGSRWVGGNTGKKTLRDLQSKTIQSIRFEIRSVFGTPEPIPGHKYVRGK